MFKNKVLLILSVFMCLSVVGKEDRFQLEQLLSHCKTIGMSDDVAQIFLQNPDMKLLKNFYREAAKHYHPDVNNKDGAKQAFQAVSSAHEKLIEYTNQPYRVLSNSYAYNVYSLGIKTVQGLKDVFNWKRRWNAYKAKKATASSTSRADAGSTGSSRSGVSRTSTSLNNTRLISEAVAGPTKSSRSGASTIAISSNNTGSTSRADAGSTGNSKSSASTTSTSSNNTGSTSRADAGSTGSNKSDASTTSTSSNNIGGKSAGAYTSYSYAASSSNGSGYSNPTASVKSMSVFRVRPIYAVACLGIAGYGCYSLKNYWNERCDKKIEKQKTAEVTIKAPTNKQLQTVGGLAVISILGVIAYKTYQYYYENMKLKEVAIASSTTSSIKDSSIKKSK